MPLDPSVDPVDVVCLPIAPKPEEKESKQVIDVRKKLDFKRKVIESIEAQGELHPSAPTALSVRQPARHLRLEAMDLDPPISLRD